jgi:DNA polymerase-3 subunit alpha (Gram-positive type)
LAKILLGKAIHENPMTIEDAYASRREFVTVSGEVYMLESRTVGAKATLITSGAIYDGTSSMYFKVFNEPVSFKVGDAIVVQGKLQADRYQGNELVLSADNIAEGTPLPNKHRVDDAPVKRVELQSFTFMSNLSGAADVADFVKEAKNLGHSAIAITDRAVVQSLYGGYKAGKANDIKVISGLTAHLVDETVPIVYGSGSGAFADKTFVVFDVETTGFSNIDDYVIELGAAKFVPSPGGERTHVLADSFNVIVKPQKAVPAHITVLTGITQELVDSEGIDITDAIAQFDDFIGDCVLVAHNAQFDRDFLSMSYKRAGITQRPITLIDTLMWSRVRNTDMKLHGLDKLARRYGVALKDHHRAFQDSEATGYVMLGMLDELLAQGFTSIEELNTLRPEDHHKNVFPNQITIWAKDAAGLKNLYKIVSLSHTKLLSREPVISKSVLNEYREGLIIASGSHLGQVFEYAMNKSPEMVREALDFYDVIEIQPSDISRHLVGTTTYESIASIDRAWQTIYREARALSKPIVATGFAHYPSPERAMIHNIILYNEMPLKRIEGTAWQRRKGRHDNPQGPCHIRTTQEMLDSFPWLSKEEAYEVVVTASNAIADQCELIPPFPNGLFAPNIPDADETLTNMTRGKAASIYGTPLPELVENRLNKELTSIINNKFAGIYLISQKLVKNSVDAGYLVGSRGSVGSSFVATMAGITEVNPLAPHYVCSECKWSVFFQTEDISSGFDLPDKMAELFDLNVYSSETVEYLRKAFQSALGANYQALVDAQEPACCPKCAAKLLKDGQEIRFETFLGFNGDKTPDIDLNFSGEYQATAHNYTKELFGEKNVFRAGTIATVAQKTAFSFVDTYCKHNEYKWSSAEKERIASMITGARRSTGQHPGGIVVVPDYIDVETVTPVQYPANDASSEWKTTHFDYHAFEENLLKLDILGHDAPSNLRFLQDFTGIDPRTVPPTDPKVLKLFYNPGEALGVDMERIKVAARTGTLGLPEMGTKLLQDMFIETRPRSFGELLNISGLSHGTGVWVGNAQELIRSGTCTIKTVIGCRDDIMNYLILKGHDESEAFKIMESVRKGKGLTPEWIQSMKDHDVPQWYIDSCLKIEYMFPRAHAAAYVLDAMRIGWYKVYHPTEFYAAIFSARFNTEDCLEMLRDSGSIAKRIEEATKDMADKKRSGDINAANKVAKLINALNMALEAKERGVTFGSVRLYGSHAFMYRLDPVTRELIPPFSSIPGIGETAALGLFEEAQKAPFTSLEDLKVRAGVNKTNIGALRDMGCLASIESKQHTFF